MLSENCSASVGGAVEVGYTVASLLGDEGAAIVRGDEDYVWRAAHSQLGRDEFVALSRYVKYIGVTKGFRDVIDCFRDVSDGVPSGFRIAWRLSEDGVLLGDLVRDIGYGENGVKRPTRVLFSADSADPYEVGAVKHIISKITTNPAIIYDRFIHNPKANVGGRFRTREEVLSELANVLGPGVDISVELNDPFASESEILEEVAKVEEIVSKYRLVVKVPHLGPITKENAAVLAAGGAMPRHDEGTAKSAFYSHNLALMLREHGYRVNFTLMFEPYQTALALQARPAYINCFMRNRYHMSEALSDMLANYDASGDAKLLDAMRARLIEKDYLSPADADMDAGEVEKLVRRLLRYRGWNTQLNCDGLDQARHELRLLKNANLPETRLIICSLDGDMYGLVDNMLMEDEFSELSGRVVISVAPDYLAKFASAPDVITYNRSFLRAVMR